jgi:radical SAM/Cys-rich protein
MDCSAARPSFVQKLSAPLMAEGILIMQINVGYRCNLACRHCHIEAGPERAEMMSREVMEQCLQVIKSHPIPTIDITGGSPEMNHHLAWFLEECGRLRRRLIVRTNAVILLEEQYAFLMELYAENHVEVFASFPHLDPERTDRIRGEGVFRKLIEVIGKLNSRGYGHIDSGLILNLVYNPGGAYLPGSQAGLESHYRRTLKEKYGIVFNNLFCIANMPIGRYLHFLQKTDNHEDYMKAIIDAFNPAALKKAMCRTTISVSWKGGLHDCDFNQILGLTINHGAPDHISAFDFNKLSSRRIVVGNHCYGCTAGAGSSCQGEVA